MSVVAQKFGRKKCIYIGFCIIALGTRLQTGARTREMFIVSRLFVAMSSAFFGAVPLLVGETAYPTPRGIVTSIFQTLYYVSPSSRHGQLTGHEISRVTGRGEFLLSFKSAYRS
jgi:MFS family permease